MNPLVITYVPTGMLMRRSDTPYIPISPEEIIADVRTAVGIGITSVHLHARAEDEGPTWEKRVFERIIRGIREFAPDLVVSVTTSGRVYNTFESRSDALFLEGAAKPDMASLTLSSLNFNKTASINEPCMIRRLAECMMERGIKPELEVFDSGMVNYAKYLIRKDVLKSPCFFSVILGNIACAQGTMLHAGVLANDLPSGSVAVFGGIGNSQLPVNAMAMAMGYGVRIGLEDNIWYDEARTKLASNAEYLERIHRLAADLGRRICTPAELRTQLGLLPGSAGGYGTAKSGGVL